MNFEPAIMQILWCGNFVGMEWELDIWRLDWVGMGMKILGTGTGNDCMGMAGNGNKNQHT